MSNFTKSIVYSGVVLVAGLVAVFSIYNNMASTDGSMVAGIEPAAGGYTSSMPDASSIMDGTSGFVTKVDMNADEAMSDVEDMLTTSPAEEAAEEAAENAVEEATDELATEMATDIEHAVEDAKDAAAASVEGEEAKEMAKDMVEEQAEDMAEEAAEEAIESTEPEPSAH